MKKVSVNHDLCVCCNSCVYSAPEVFANNPDGTSKVIKPIIEDDEEGVQTAIEVCPSDAITLEDVDDEETENTEEE